MEAIGSNPLHFPPHSLCSDLDLKGNHFSPLPLLCSDLDLVGDRFLPLHFPRKSTLFILIVFRPRWVDIWDLVKIILAAKFCPFLDQNKVYEWYLVGCKKNNALARCLLVWIWCFCFFPWKRSRTWNIFPTVDGNCETNVRKYV